MSSREIVLANRSYELHMTNEGDQLQQGLRADGWVLSGPGYDGMNNVPAILSHYQPTHVFVQDKRDWDPKSGCPGASQETSFRGIHVLDRRPSSVRVATVVKDAGPDGSDYHKAFCEEIGADAVAIYYHPLSVLKYCPWLQHYTLIRIYHTVNEREVPKFTAGTRRRRICGSGAIGALTTDVYPLRSRVFPRAAEFGMAWLKHPGYVNDHGPHTPRYLSFLSQFKVSFATASAYGFALRKIIEAVCCGCTPVTDLPTYDVLPEIDRALVRIKPDISDNDLKMVLQDAADSWDEDGRRKWAEKAIRYYNHTAMGQRLSSALRQM